MNATLETLLEDAERDPLPMAHTSSEWQRYGTRTVVERQGTGLVIRGAGLGAVSARHWATRTLHSLERLSYRSVTDALRSHRAVWRATKALARDLHFALTFDVWKCSVILALLMDHWNECGLAPGVFVLIGDGYGFLSALIRRQLPESRLYCIDLPKILVIQAHTHERADRGVTMSVLSSDGGTPAAVTFVAPQDIERIPDAIDCAINIASMQEMRKASIEAYFAFLRRRSTPASRFYCVNRLDKTLCGGEVVRFADYPWHPEDTIFLDGPCPYYTHVFSPSTLPKGPRVLGIRVPFVNDFDGPTMHRLVRLAPLDGLSR